MLSLFGALIGIAGLIGIIVIVVKMILVVLFPNNDKYNNL